MNEHLEPERSAAHATLREQLIAAGLLRPGHAALIAPPGDDPNNAPVLRLDEKTLRKLKAADAGTHLPKRRRRYRAYY